VSRLTLRIVIILAAISIVGITITQIYWVQKAFDLKENQFNHDVVASLTNVANKIIEISKTPTAANNPVVQLSTNYFVVMVNGPVDSNVLEFLLVTEFEKRHITANFDYGIYDCAEKCMAGRNSVFPQKISNRTQISELPTWNSDGYYFGVMFSGVEANLLSQMGIWGFSSIVLLIVIFFFVYTLLVILRQRRLSEIQKDFINNMTHEFKTPISTIALSTQVLKDPGIVQFPERLLNYATIIENENQRLKQQVERVLQMARIEKEDLGLKKETLPLHDIIREAVNNKSFQSANVSIQLNLQDGDSLISVDKLHMVNVLYNLLDNAIKYNVRKPEITISTTRHERMIHIEIQDNGIGLHKDNLKKIFNRFYRVPTGNVHDVKGFGLGLSYVKKIVEAHGGKVTVVSDPEAGSRFTIQLPLAL
jgi:two-component system phosphate regulon sensor histidine kinase PhoR